MSLPGGNVWEDGSNTSPHTLLLDTMRMHHAESNWRAE
jgi:hypothetical protein